MPEPFAVCLRATFGHFTTITARAIEEVPDEYTAPEDDDNEFCEAVREHIDEYRTTIEAERDLSAYERGAKIAYLGFHAPNVVAAFAYCDEQPDERLDDIVAQYGRWQKIDGIGLATRLGVSLVELGAIVERDPRFSCTTSPFFPQLNSNAPSKDPEHGTRMLSWSSTTSDSTNVTSTVPLASEEISIATTDGGGGDIENESKSESDDSSQTKPADEKTDGFDPTLETELARGAYGTPENALTGEIRAASAMPEGKALFLRVWVPFDDETTDERGETFTEYFSLPDPTRLLDDSKFGRLLLEHEYDRDSAGELLNEEVECIYQGGEWHVLDPADADTTTEEEEATATENSSEGSSTPRLGRTRPAIFPVVLALGGGFALSVAVDSIGLGSFSTSPLDTALIGVLGGLLIIVGWCFVHFVLALRKVGI